MVSGKPQVAIPTNPVVTTADYRSSYLRLKGGRREDATDASSPGVCCSSRTYVSLGLRLCQRAMITVISLPLLLLSVALTGSP